MSFTIDKGIPLPSSQVTVSSSDVLKKMSAGDSILLPRKSIRQIAKYARKHGYSVVTRSEEKEKWNGLIPMARLWVEKLPEK